MREIERKGIKISFNDENKLDGIINYMKKQSNGNIFNLINITASKEESPSGHPLKNIILYEDDSKFTYTANVPDSWICIDFNERRIIPTHYTVRTANTDYHLKNWVIEGSSDNSSWEKLDEQSNCSVTNGKKVVHTFPIANDDCKECRYVRIRTTGPNWNGNNYLDLSAFEFHGTLI